eukprot:gene11408-4575_t
MSWSQHFEKIKDIFRDFSELITEFDHEKNESTKEKLKDEANETNFNLNQEYENLNEEIRDNFDKSIYDVELKFEKLRKSYNEAKEKGFLESGEKSSDEKFGVGGTVANYYSTINERAKQFANMLSTPPSTPKLTPSKKEKDFLPMPLPLDPEDKKEIEKMIENPEMKAQIIDKIMKAFPSFKKEQLDSLSVKDLLKISITLGFDFSNLNLLKAPENATKEVKELAQNLENLKREREIQEDSNPSSVKRSNAYLDFMKEFRKENAGKFDAKIMMKEGAKSYYEQKNGGCSQIEPSQCKPKKKSKISTNNYDHVFVKEEAKKTRYNNSIEPK